MANSTNTAFDRHQWLFLSLGQLIITSNKLPMNRTNYQGAVIQWGIGAKPVQLLLLLTVSSTCPFRGSIKKTGVVG